MGMGAGFLVGLGQGLQGVGQNLQQGRQLDQEARQRALQLLLQQDQLDMQQQAQQRLQAGQEQEQAFKLVNNLPGGTDLDPQTQALLARTHLAPFMEAQQTLPSQDITASTPPTVGGQGGALQLGAMKSPSPTGKVTSVPTEDSKARAAAQRNEATLARVQLIYNQKAQIAAAANDVRIRIAASRDVNEKQALLMRARQLDLAAQSLDQRVAEFGQGMDFKYNVTMPDIVHDNETADYRAEHPGGGGAGKAPGVTADALLGGQAGRGAPAPAAPPVAPPRPPVTHSRGATPSIPEGTRRQNSHGDWVVYKGGQWVLDTPAPGATKGGAR